MPLPPNDPYIEAIADRLRSVMARQPGHRLSDMAAILSVDEDALRRLIEEPERTIDVSFLIDVVAALVREFAVDPNWLLTGRYDSSTHRQALLLGENATHESSQALRDFVREQYQRLRDYLQFTSSPLVKPQD